MIPTIRIDSDYPVILIRIWRFIKADNSNKYTQFKETEKGKYIQNGREPIEQGTNFKVNVQEVGDAKCRTDSKICKEI